MYMKAIIVLVLCVLIALCMHEYDVFTIKSAIKSLPLVDSVVVSFQVIFQWLYTLFQRYAGTVQIRTSRTSHGERIFTADELKIYTREETGLYLAILGRVYDVSEGKEFYGQKGHYRHFTGRDGSRAFVTGDFTESGLTDHVLDLPSEDLLSITSWVERYNQRYKYKGKLVGRYYDDTGTPTDYQIALEGKIKLAKEDGAAALQEKLQFPPCNVEWTQDDGTRVWCTTMSAWLRENEA
ncbi:neuferricin isoform X2 [Anabrus simplex]|uniref:neuferricin isoform X2 n=1 Tax=Anabrus simplex TaxID=316456 RepID=UPI0034DCE359